MSQLHQLKKYLTLDDVAKNLSSELKESVTKADVLTLGLDGRLTISVNFINLCYAMKGKIILNSEALSEQTEKLVDGSSIPLERTIDEHRVLRLDGEIHSIDDVWDLLMQSGERLELERENQQLTGESEVILVSSHGILVYKHTDPNVVFELQRSIFQEFSLEVDRDPLNYVSETELPQRSVLLVRIDSFDEFKKYHLKTSDKPSGTKTVNTQLKVISTLVDALIGGQTGIKNTDAEAVLSVLDQQGLEHPVEKKTLANYLEQAREL